MAIFFLHRDVYSASSHYPMSISAIDPVCPQTQFAQFAFGDECDAVPFRDAMRHKYPWNEEHSGESFRSLPFIVFEIYACKVENCRFCENLTFDLS